MKDLFFTTDLLALFRNDKYYGEPKNLVVALRKCGLSSVGHGNNIDQMYHELAVQIMDQGGESEPFLSGTFIYPEAIVKLLKEGHYKVAFSGGDWQRIYTWLDTYGQRSGHYSKAQEEELIELRRKMAALQK